VRGIAGIFLRQIWVFSSMFIIMAFSALLRANQVKSITPPLLESNADVMDTERPLMIIVALKEDFDFMEASPSAMDRWLYKHAEVVYSLIR